MGWKHRALDGGMDDWKRSVTALLQQLDVDVKRLWQLAALPSLGGSVPPGDTPFDPLFGGGDGTIAEGFLNNILTQSDSTGLTPGGATLNLWAVVGGTWQATGDTVSVTNRSPHLWLPTGHPLQCVSIDGEYRPTIQYSPMFRATLTEDLSGAGPAAADLEFNDSGTWTSYTPGISVDVYPSLSLGTNTVTSGKAVNLQFTGGNFWAVSAEC
jgi:hypothetical protein